MEQYETPESGRQLATVLLGADDMRRPMFAPPGMPADRLKTLRDAFAKTLQDEQCRMENTETNVTRRVRIEYADQNDEFASMLPRSGVLAGAYRDIQGNSDWYLLSLDEPFDYQMKVGEPFQFRLVRVDHFLIRSRWADHPIGAAEPTSVFILLVDDSQASVPDSFDPALYVHIAWGTAVTEANV